MNLVEQRDLGSKYADRWLESALCRLNTDAGKTLAAEIAHSDHTDWWVKKDRKKPGT